MKKKVFETVKDFEKYLENSNSTFYFCQFRKKPQVVSMEIDNESN